MLDGGQSNSCLYVLELPKTLALASSASLSQRLRAQPLLMLQHRSISKISPSATPCIEPALHNIHASENDGCLVSESLHDSPRLAYVAIPAQSNELPFNILEHTFFLRQTCCHRKSLIKGINDSKYNKRKMLGCMTGWTQYLQP